MKTLVSQQPVECLILHKSVSWLEIELQHLEDAYAECLGDAVDAKTLTSLWSRIKAIKKEIFSRKTQYVC